MTPSEQSNRPREVARPVEEAALIALNTEQARRHREWLVQHHEATTADHREWIEAVMEKDRAVQRKILSELRAIRRVLEQK